MMRLPMHFPNPVLMRQTYLYRLLHAIFIALLLLLAISSRAEEQQLLGGLELQKYGTGEFRRFGFLVYEAQLWGSANPGEPPIALQLTYKRDIVGAKIVSASVEQMKALGASDRQLADWETAMMRIFPNVRPGDQITGIYRQGSATFPFNNREIGKINDPEFARLFFGIWLDPRTSEHKLRSRLLQIGAG